MTETCLGSCWGGAPEEADGAVAALLCSTSGSSAGAPASPGLELTRGSEALGPPPLLPESDPLSAQAHVVSLGLVLEAEDP